MIRYLYKILLLLTSLLFVLSGCKTSRQSDISIPKQTDYLSSKVLLTVPHSNGAVLTVHGTMKLKSAERMQLSFLMPIFRTEVARIEATPEDLLLVDRMGKRYVRITRAQLKKVASKNADFGRLEKILFDAAKPNAKRSLSGSELGISALAKASIELSDFSDAEFELTPTNLSSKYREVSLEELLEMLLSISR